MEHVTGAGPAVTAIVAWAVLLPKVGSVVAGDEPTDAVFVTVVPAGAETRAVISSVEVEFGAMVPMFQTPVDDEYAPAGDAETKVMPFGKVSVATTPVDVALPDAVTVSV